MGLIEKFKKFIEQNNLIQPGYTVIVAVSGGVDSMCLLELFYRCRNLWDLKLIVAHFNHKLRGKEADEDALLVKKVCEEKNLPFQYCEKDIKSYAEEKKLSIEMAGRELRYQFFESLVKKFEPAILATAHTLDDNSETMILNFLKGKALRGLTGIPMKRDWVIRPLLFATKRELYQYAKVEGIPFREDYTNREPSTQRNVIRLKIMPLIEKYINPGINNTLFEHATIWQNLVRFIENFCGDLYSKSWTIAGLDYVGLQKKCLLDLPEIVLHEFILQVIERLENGENQLDFEKVKQFYIMLHQNGLGRQVKLSSQYTAYFYKDVVYIARELENFEEIDVTIGETVESKYFKFWSEIVSKPKDLKANTNKNVEYIDMDRIEGKLKLRAWKQGDVIRPLGLKRTKKVSDIFIDKKIPAPLKKRIPLLISKGEIVWVCGIVLNENFKITENTKNVLKIVYEAKYERNIYVE